MDQVEALLVEAERQEPSDPVRSDELCAEVERLLEATPALRGPEIDARLQLLYARRDIAGRKLAGALRHVAIGRRASVELPSSPTEVRLMLVEAVALSELGHLAAALAVLDDAEAMGRHLDLAELGQDAALARASVLRHHGRLGEAAAAYDAILVTLEDAAGPRQVAARLNAASAFWQVGRSDDAAEQLRLSADAIERFGVRGLQDWQHALEAWVLAAQQRFAEAIARASGVVQRGWEVADPGAVLSASRLLAQLLEGPHGPEGGRQAALELRLDLVRRAEESGWKGDLPQMCTGVADLYEQQGDFASALDWHRRAAEARAEHERWRGERLIQAESVRVELNRLAVETRQLRRHNEELTALSARLAASNEARARLLRTLAHDIRSPLTAIMAIPDLLPGLDPDLASVLYDAIGRIDGTIEAAVNSDEEMSLAPERFTDADLVLLGQAVVRLRRGRAREKSIELVFEGPPSAVCRTDPVAVGRILDNLVSNALKFSEPNRRVWVRVRRGPAAVSLIVEDEGPGLGDDPERLFGYQARGPSLPTGAETSSGYGLYIVRTLVDALGAELVAENRDVGGAGIRVRVPRCPRSAPAAR